MTSFDLKVWSMKIKEILFITIYMDEEKKLIKEGIVDLQDQILLFSADGVEKFEILNYESLFISLGNL